MTTATRPLGVWALLRISNLPTVWSNVVAAGLLAGAGVTWPHWGLVAASISLLYVGGMVLNDLMDFSWDQEHRPKRPLVAGAVSLTTARTLAVGLLGGGILLLVPAPRVEGLWASAGLLAAIVLYDRFHKGNPAAPLLMGLCRALAYVTAAAALTGAVSPPVLVGAAVQLVYVLLLTLAARHLGPRPWAQRVGLVSWLIAGIGLLDGVLLAVYISPWLLLLGLVSAVGTRVAQLVVPGD